MLDRLRAALPAAYLLDPADLRGLAAWLADRGWARAPVTAAAPAGDGNMNLTLRVTTPEGTLIVKQARPWVERFPQLAAPVSRATVEARFYATVGAAPALAARLPRLLGFDADSAILILEDLGPTRDLSGAWRGEGLPDGLVEGLLGWLGALHALRVPVDPVWENRALRALNHAHVFALPLEDDGDRLDAWVPGLAAVARRLRADRPWRAAIVDAGRRYLADGDTLVHGDLHWGSVVQADRGWFVLDPEFAFRGDPAWDTGVVLAHLVFAGWTPDAALAVVGPRTRADLGAARGYAAAELMRRLLGVARLPVAPPTLAQATAWLDLAHAWATR